MGDEVQEEVAPGSGRTKLLIVPTVINTIIVPNIINIIIDAIDIDFIKVSPSST